MNGDLQGQIHWLRLSAHSMPDQVFDTEIRTLWVAEMVTKLIAAHTSGRLSPMEALRQLEEGIYPEWVFTPQEEQILPRKIN